MTVLLTRSPPGNPSPSASIAAPRKWTCPSNSANATATSLIHSRIFDGCNYLSKACHPERIRQGCAKDLSVRSYLEPSECEFCSKENCIISQTPRNTFPAPHP